MMKSYTGENEGGEKRKTPSSNKSRGVYSEHKPHVATGNGHGSTTCV